MPEHHARLSPSSSKRWLACPGSVPWEAELPEKRNDAAEEGTAAHLLAEARLKNDAELLKKAQKSKWYCEAMETAVDTYVDYIAEHTTPNAMRYIEQQLGIFPPDCWGTSDCVICADDTLHVLDLKYGKGVKVDANENPQCLLYAWGAYREFGFMWDFEKVQMHIIQPRLDCITSWEISVSELEERIHKMLPGVQAARLAADQGDGERHAGSHCQFCKAAPFCTERARNAVEGLLKAIDTSIREVQPESAGAIIEALPAVESWAKGIKDGAYDAALHGTKIPGFKLVAGRATRKIADQGEAIDKLLKAGFEPVQIMELRGITDLERTVGKKDLSNILDNLITRSEAKPSLVRESDPRPEYSQAAQDFSIIEEE